MAELKKVLVTGSTGFVGGVIRRSWTDVLPWPAEVDLTDHESTTEAVEQLVSDESFDRVLHLAAQSSPLLSGSQARETWMVNVMGSIHLTEALTAAHWKGRFLYVSSGSVYGDAVGPVTESTPVAVTSPYVASKLAAESAVLEWGRRTATDALVVRPFNHSGVGQSPHYFLPSMADQIAALAPTGGTVEVGNLDVYRDFLHVDDVIRAYRALLQQGRAQEVYNLASGSPHSLREILARLIQKSGRRVELQVSAERFRAESGEPQRVDLSKLRSHTGWESELGLDRLLDELMEDRMRATCQKPH